MTYHRQRPRLSRFSGVRTSWSTPQWSQAKSTVARRTFGENPHADRGIEPIEPFDTPMFGMDVSEYAGTVQAIVSDVDGEAPEPDALEEAFAEPTGEYSTQYHPNVSTITGSW